MEGVQAIIGLSGKSTCLVFVRLQPHEKGVEVAKTMRCDWLCMLEVPTNTEVRNQGASKRREEMT